MIAPPPEIKPARRPLGMGVLAALVLLALGAFLLIRARQNSLVGQWQAKDTDTGGAIETTTVRFLPDGLATFQVRTSKGSLLHASSGGPGGGMSEVLAAMLPTVARVNVNGAYTIKGDVLTLKVAGVNYFDAQDQPVSLSGETHPAAEVFRFQKRGDLLTMDKLDGTPPLKLTRQAE